MGCNSDDMLHVWVVTVIMLHLTSLTGCNHNDVNCYRCDHIVANDVTCAAGL